MPNEDSSERLRETRRSVLKGAAALGVGGLLTGSASAAERWRVTGPNGELAAELSRESADGPLRFGVTRNGTPVLSPSPVGVTTESTDFTTGLTLVERRDRTANNSYRTETGKRLVHHHRANEATFTFEAGNGERVHVDVRVAEQGAAYRYRFPGSGTVAVTGEASSFTVPADATGWMHPYHDGYENEYREVAPNQTAGEYGFPTLFETAAGDWALLTEADISGRYAASRLTTEPTSTRYDVTLPQDVVESERPLATPWRVAIVGDLADVVESDLVQSLSRPDELDDTSWIEPGRVAWSWWSNSGSPSNYEIQKEYVDYAAEHGWEFVLVDAGWQDEWVPDLIDYADERGVDIILWSSWNDSRFDGPSGEGLDTEAKREEKLSRWSDWGAAGVKVDYMNSDEQSMMEFYDEVLEATARHEMMINFHGATAPKGRRRTWPHEMTREAVKGAEYYKWSDLSITHNVNLPFTRNVIGAMDYTPTTFSASDEATETTPGHELALSVVYESGWQHLADNVDVYEQWPNAERFLDELPAAWDETAFVGGRPGNEATIARRKGQEWFVGSIVAGEGHTIEVPLDFVGSNRPYVAEITTDVTGERALELDHRNVRRGDALTVEVSENGGFAVRLAPAQSLAPELSVADGDGTIEAGESATVETTLTNHARSAIGDLDLSLTAPDGWTVAAESGTETSQLASGESLTAAWTVTAPEDALPGNYDVEVAASYSGVGGPATVESSLELSVPLDPLPDRWETFASTDAEFGAIDQRDALVIDADGEDVWTADDEYGAIYDAETPLGERGTVVTTVTEQESTSEWAKSGIMVRNDITGAESAAGYLILAITPGNGFSMQWDSDGDGFVNSSATIGNTTYPARLKLEKEGTTFTGYYSTDGSTWTELESATLDAAADQQDVGMFATSHSGSTLGRSQFTGFEVRNR